MAISPALLTELISEKAKSLGFSACGFAAAEKLDQEAEWLKGYLDEGRNGGLGYMDRDTEKKTDPSLVLPNARSVIIVLLSYSPGVLQNHSCSFKVSKYAYGMDYHVVINKKLKALKEFILAKVPGAGTFTFCDSNVVLEKAWAARCGLGWTGKNTLLLNDELGSWFFIGGIITDIELVYSSVQKDLCGSCTKCMDACPTGALTGPYRLDAGKCISCATIEKGKTTRILKGQNNNWIYGCDICQEVCPWNSQVLPGEIEEFSINPFIRDAGNTEWIDLTEDQFNNIFKTSPLSRTGFQKIKKNIAGLTE